MSPLTVSNSKTLSVNQFDDYEKMSKQAAEDILALVAGHPKAVICLATGSTPTHTYELLAKGAKGEEKRFANVHIVKLDEWGGLPIDHPSTCEFYLRKYVLTPLGISQERFLSLRPDAGEPKAECARVQAELDRLGGIDLCVLGLGVNGHLGFNEPAESIQPYVHVAALAPKTQKHPMLEGSEIVPSYGMTLGMANILSAKQIMLLVNGQHKVSQLQRLLSQKVETSFPASFLWLHNNVRLYSNVHI